MYWKYFYDKSQKYDCIFSSRFGPRNPNTKCPVQKVWRYSQFIFQNVWTKWTNGMVNGKFKSKYEIFDRTSSEFISNMLLFINISFVHFYWNSYFTFHEIYCWKQVLQLKTYQSIKPHLLILYHSIKGITS